jgi:GWxTD domain-containing protein
MRTLLFFALLCLAPRALFALDLGVSTAVFNAEGKPYVEVNLEIAAATITYQPISGTTDELQASAEVLVLLKQGEKIVNYEKYALKSPGVKVPQSLLDVKRLSVPAGDYILEVTVTDLNTPANKKTYSAPLKVTAPEKIHLTEVQLLRGFKKDETSTDNPFVKNGFFLEPLPFSFYDKNSNKLAFYAEVYQSNKSVTEENYLVRYFIEENKGNGTKELVAGGGQRKTPSAVDVILVQMDISKVTSGNFTLTVEVRNKLNELLAVRTVDFQRSNPLLNMNESEITQEMVSKQFVQDLSEDNLRFSMRAVAPLAYGDESEEVKNALANGNYEAMRFFLFRHFARIDPVNPRKAYMEYITMAGAVHEKFKSGFRYGFETDRGRMYIRYGQPNDVIHVEDDPNAPPYEIWVYYDFPKTRQKNVKFLFYNPGLAGEDFVLLHSTARGEINNKRWERDLYAKQVGSQEQFNGDNTHDSLEMRRNFNRNARVYFEDY